MRGFRNLRMPFLFLYFARNILHLPFSSVHLIKFCGARQFCANKPAHLVAAKRYLRKHPEAKPLGIN